MKRSSLKLDLDAVDNGKWVGDIPDLEGVRFRVRGTEYLPYQKAMRNAMMTTGRRQRLQQTVDMDKFTAVQGRLVSEHLLLDWDGIEDDDGAAFPCTKEAALEAMTDRAYRPLQRGVLYAIDIVDTGLTDFQEEAEGN